MNLNRGKGLIWIDAFKMPPVLSKPTKPSLKKWQKYERHSMAKQQEFVERYKDDFDKVPVTNSDSIKVGDHLVLETLERKYYDHHTLTV